MRRAEFIIDNLMLPSTAYRSHRHSHVSQRSDLSGNGDDFIPMALDLHIAPGPSPMTGHQRFDMQDGTNNSHMGDPKVHSRDYFNTKVPHSSSRKVSQDHDNIHGSSRPVSRPGSHGGSQPSSPHIAYQEKGREPTTEIIDTLRKRNEQGITTNLGSIAAFDKASEAPRNGHNSSDKFKLQEVPKRRRSGASTRDSKSEFPSTVLDTSITNPPSNSAPASASTQLKEQHVVVSSSSPRSAQSNDTFSPSPRSPKDSRPQTNGSKDSSISHSSPLTTQLQHVPLRGDSLQKTSSKPSILPRKEIAGTKLSYSSLPLDTGLEFAMSTPPPTTKSQGSPTASMHLNGNKTSSKLLDSPVSRHSLEPMQPPPRAKDRPVVSGGSTTESFISPRAPPHPPMELHRVRNESVSTIRSESTKNGDLPASPSLPRYSAGGDFSMDEDMARILGNEDGDQASFLRRVSNSVRHARSYSDRGTRLSKEHKWPKSPLNGSNTFPREISSPTSSSPETREELMWFKNELRRERQKTVEKDQHIVELEAALDGRTNIKQMNHELNEKRSTMIVLDTQKEIVVRELEVLTEHIAATKKSRDPLDLSQMRNVVLREFGESLEKLKSTFSPQIMDLTEQRNDLVDEVSRLTQLREQSVQEFEQLSVKNAQLAELNNQLVHQIQALYKATANSTPDTVRPPPQGLGIYTHHTKDKSNISMDSRELRPSITESSYTGTTVTNEHEIEPATILTAPQVVNIRKGQPKKFNWKKGGQNVAKGVTKGLKGAFTSNDTTKYQQREGSITEGVPYGAMVQTQEYPSTSLPKGTINDPSRQGFGFFNNNANSNNQRPRPAQPRGSSNGASLGIAAENASGMRHRCANFYLSILMYFQFCMAQSLSNVPSMRESASLVSSCVASRK